MKRLKNKATVTAAITLGGLLATGANGAVLTFDITGIGNFDNIDQSYGDNVTATTMGSFSYGSAEGFTPNVVVEYGDSDPSLWTTGYGNLTNVLFENLDGSGVLTVDFSADPGFEVLIHEFDLVGYDSAFGTPPTIDLVDVSDASNSLFSLANAVISDTTSTNFSFSPALQAPQLTITIDARNLGNLNDDIAIDNIVFSQVAIPEPSSALLIGISVMGFMLRRSRR